MDIKENVILAPYTGFKIGGPARYFCIVQKVEDLRQALAFAEEKGLKYFVLGSGTNLLVADAGFDGLAIKVQLKDITLKEEIIVAGTGLTLAEIFVFAQLQGMVGFEKLATVPGTLGGALYNNAHYMDDLISNYVEWVEVLDPQGSVRKLQKPELEFKYDSSLIKTGNLVAVRAGLKLPYGSTEQSKKQYLELLKKRNSSQPYGTFNAGCIFQNAPQQLGPGNHGTSAGWLIEQAGMKGAKVGDIEVSEKHGNFFVNKGQGSATQVLQLIDKCRSKVKEKFGVELELEIKILK